jgi:hypothetical protein
MKKAFIISPYAGHVRRNRQYLLMAMQHSVSNNEIPFASHELYPRLFPDNDPHERQKGIEFGQAWLDNCDMAVVYNDHGVSSGMRSDIEMAHEKGLPVEYRKIGRVTYLSMRLKISFVLIAAVLLSITWHALMQIIALFS